MYEFNQFEHHTNHNANTYELQVISVKEFNGDLPTRLLYIL